MRFVSHTRKLCETCGHPFAIWPEESRGSYAIMFAILTPGLGKGTALWTGHPDFGPGLMDAVIDQGMRDFRNIPTGFEEPEESK